MKKNEINPDGKSTAFSRDHALENDIFREILPVIFHKLKNKLTPILGYAQILKAKAADDFSKDRLGKIENNASELADLLNILKEYFKVEPAAVKPGNINRILQNMNPYWHDISADEKITITLDLEPDLPDFPLHSGQMRILLQAMTANAVKALQMKTELKKGIRLTTRLEGGHPKLIVRDNGIGMSAEEKDNIWAPFYSKYPDCAGLGLVLCEKIIANHAATCLVSSRPGEFSEFEITFPPVGNADGKAKKNPRLQQTDKK
jgi:signal transduction histidine kinase